MRTVSFNVCIVAFVALLSSRGDTQEGRDCNGNGVSDPREILEGNASDCDQNGVPDECDVAPLNLTLGAGPSMDATPQSMVAADFDGDGREDLCVGNLDSKGASFVSVLLSRDGGVFKRQDYDSEFAPTHIAAADFDGDGDVDVFAVRHETAALFANGNDGTLEAPRSVSIEKPIGAAATGDLDGDGLDDLVVSARLFNEVSVFWGSPQGLSETSTSFTIGVSPSSTSLVLADLNGDDTLDIAVAQPAGNAVVILWNRGGRAFEQKKESLQWTEPLLVLADDLSGDGILDLLIVGAGGLGAFVNDGKGAFATPLPFALPQRAGAAATGDFDGDGDIDVALAAEETPLTTILNDGQAAFAVAVTLDLEPLPVALTTGDFDSDGRTDLATTAFDGIDLLLQSQRLPPVSFMAVKLPKAGHTAAVADFNGDALPDIALAQETGVRICLNSMEGRFTLGRTIPPLRRWKSIATGDFDSDLFPDLVTANDFRIVPHFGVGRGHFETGDETRGTRGIFSFVTTAPIGEDPGDNIVSVNFGTGEVTIHTAIRQRTAAGQRFEQQPESVQYQVVAGPRMAAAGDFNGDGHVDLAVASELGSQLTVFRNQGNGRLLKAPTYRIESASFVATGDIDADRDTDILVLSNPTESLSILLNGGDGLFEVTRTIEVGRALTMASLADVNGDRVADIVASDARGTVTILLGLGGGAMESPYHFRAVRGAFGNFWLGVADMNADTDQDLVVTGQRESKVLLNGATGPDFLERVCTETSFLSISASVPGDGDVVRVAKFMVPARQDDAALIPPLFQNVRRYLLHQDFLEAIFADRFPAGVSVADYDRLVNRRDTRDYFIGVMGQLKLDDGSSLYGFSVIAGFDDLDELPQVEEVELVYETLRRIFPLEPLAYLPLTNAARESAAAWNNPSFAIHFDDVVQASYQAYTRGVGYGRVRLLDEKAFQTANESGDFSFQDILILSRAPRDIEGGFGGVITAEPQGALSHLSIRTARRKTPNAFKRDAFETFAPFDGKLVRLEVTDTDTRVLEVDESEATSWWEQNRQELSVPPTVDPEFTGLPNLLEIDLNATEPPPEARFGGKASNFARLQQIVLTGEWERYRERGFSIPARYYLDFLNANRMPSALEPEREVTYEEYLRELRESPELQTSSRARFVALEALRDHMRREGVVSGDLIERLAQRIEEVFGGVDFRVRFRSSSNIEDAPEFNGAGLYDSTSVCTADDLDPDDVGPSICDPTRDNERGIARGLRRVWASLWNFRAYEERAFFGIDQTLSAMALLVNRAFIDERVNGVAFTGNPSNPTDTRYVISAQAGEASVVSPEPGVVPERNIVEVVDGEVVSIVRASRSSLVPEGETVMSAEQLEELGLLLWHIEQNFPVDHYQRGEVLLDIEFKIEANGELSIKQVRPFLLSEGLASPPPTFTLEIPPGVEFCDQYEAYQMPRAVYARRVTVRLAPQTIEIPTARETFSAELIEKVRFAPAGEAHPESPGLFTIRRFLDGEISNYILRFDQTFVSESRRRVHVRLTRLVFSARGDEPLVEKYTLDDEFLSRVQVSAQRGRILMGNQAGLATVLEPCTNFSYKYKEVVVTTRDGRELVLAERSGEMDPLTWVSPTRITSADLNINGTSLQVTDPFRLIFGDQRHLVNITHWVVFDPPIELPGAARPVHVVEFVDTTRHMDDDQHVPRQRTVSYLDKNLQNLTSASASARVNKGVPFRRGDANADRRVNISDALTLLDYVFRDGDEPSCPKSADVNDNGKLTVTDVVALLHYLHAGGTAPKQPFHHCGLDPTRDRLRCAAHAPCQER